jgi:hypothetical protein
MCHFVPLISFHILDLLNKMPMKVWFIKKVHNKIYIDKWILKGCKTNEKIQTKIFFERVQNRQRNTNRKKTQFQNGIWFMTNYNLEWLWNCHSDDHQNTHPM